MAKINYRVRHWGPTNFSWGQVLEGFKRKKAPKHVFPFKKNSENRPKIVKFEIQGGKGRGMLH